MQVMESSDIIIRRLNLEKDKIETIIDIIVASFRDLEKKTGIEEELASRSLASEIVHFLIPIETCIVATLNEEGKEIIVGVNFFSNKVPGSHDAREIGPIGVHPEHQGKGIGKKLMEYVIQNAFAFEGITDPSKFENRRSLRLMVDAYNPISFSLYLKLSFEVKLVVSEIRGRVASPQLYTSGYKWRRMEDKDIEMCDALCEPVIGVSRKEHLELQVRRDNPNGSASVLLKDEQIVGFTSGMSVDCISFAVDENHMKALLAFSTQGPQVEKLQMPTFFVPMVEHPDLLRWCLKEGLRIVKNMIFMVLGGYTKPQPPFIYLPSVGGL